MFGPFSESARAHERLPRSRGHGACDRLGDRVIVRGRGVARLLPSEGDRTHSTPTTRRSAAIWSRLMGTPGVRRSVAIGIDQRTVPTARSGRPERRSTAIAVGTAVAGGPPHRSQRARQRTGLLPWVRASKRRLGQGCRIRGSGSHRASRSSMRFQVSRSFWLRRRSAWSQRRSSSCVPGFFDRAGSAGDSTITSPAAWPSANEKSVGTLNTLGFRGSIAPPARPLSTLRCALTERQRSR